MENKRSKGLNTGTELESELIHKLEEIIDGSTLKDVLHALSHVCDVKSEHIEHAWQDKALADAWDTLADLIATLEFKAEERGI